MKHTIKISLLLFLFVSCGSSHVAKLLQGGEVIQDDFKTIVPFEFREGLMIVQIKINKSNYDFMIDTGASNIISQELANELNLKPTNSEYMYDVHGIRKKLGYVTLADIQIGEANFTNTLTAIIDINEVEALQCLNIDGIIGANLMRHAVWDFDFEHQEITIVDTEDKLEIPANHKKVKFFIGYQGTPSIITKVNNKRVLNNQIDTGSNGGITLSLDEFVRLNKKDSIYKYDKGYSLGRIGIYGAGQKEVFYKAVIDKLSIGDLHLNNTPLFFRGSHYKLIGLDFLKKYRMILNWSDQKMILIKTTSSNINLSSTLGFQAYYKKGPLFIDATSKSSNKQISSLISNN